MSKFLIITMPTPIINTRIAAIGSGALFFGLLVGPFCLNWLLPMPPAVVEARKAKAAQRKAARNALEEEQLRRLAGSLLEQHEDGAFVLPADHFEKGGASTFRPRGHLQDATGLRQAPVQKTPKDESHKR